MGIRTALAKVLGANIEPTDRRSIAVVDPSNLQAFGTTNQPASLIYAPEQALSVATIYRAISMISDSVAALPWATWHPDTNTIVPEQPAIIRRPDPFYTTSETMRQVTTAMLLFGEAFLWLSAPDRSGRPTVAVPISGAEVTISWNEARTRPVYRWRGQTLERNRDILHLKMIDDVRTLHGIGPIQAARWSVDGAISAERFATDFYHDGAVPDAVLETPGKLTQPEAEDLRKQWTGARAGNRSTAVLEGGLTYKPIQMSNADAQYIESRNFSVADMARLFGIPAPLLNAATQSSTLQYRNQEGLAVEYATFAVQPITERIEAAFEPLVPSTQQIRFDFTKLLRADSSTRYAVYDIALRNGILTINEVRRLEGLPPLPGGGDVPATELIIEGGTQPEVVEVSSE